MISISVISNENYIKEETKLINWLFDSGLEVFHLRKKQIEYNSYIEIVKNIPSKYHERIIIHDFYELIKEYNFRGVHLSEKKRKSGFELNSEILKTISEKKLVKGTSVHNPDDVSVMIDKYDYLWLSPVFKSISKNNYFPEYNWIVRDFAEKNKLVALGGIRADNLNDVEQRGFKNAAVLGYLWNNMDSFKLKFKELKKYNE